MPELRTERKLTYSYGVNKNRTIVGSSSFERLEEIVVSDTMGPVRVDKRESRIVVYGDWQEIQD